MFNVSEAQNGIFVVRERCLFCIKLRNTGSGKVELQKCIPGGGAYATMAAGFSGGTLFSLDEANNGTWDVLPVPYEPYVQLYLIKTRGTASGRVEVHYWAGPRTDRFHVYQSPFPC